MSAVMLTSTTIPRRRLPAPSGRVSTTTKRNLMVLSHSMERAFDTRIVDGVGLDGMTLSPGVVIGMFQHVTYFEPARERYAALAAAGNLVLAGFVPGAEPLDMPPGVHALELDADHPLAAAWVLVLLSPTCGSVLDATDEHRLAVGESTVQASRLFAASWTFRRDETADYTDAFLDEFSAALPADLHLRLRAAVAESRTAAVSPGEAQLAAATEHLLTAVTTGNERATRLRVALAASQCRAEQDQLTGLHNRHFLERYLGGVTDAPMDLMVLLVDVDDLKTANDTHGHDAGDAVLTAVADVLREQSRPGDIVVRWGGDEFLVILPGLASQEALAMAERLVREVRARTPAAPWHELDVSVSIGVSPTRRTTLPLERLDAALYTVKRSGKGRAALAAPED